MITKSEPDKYYRVGVISVPGTGKTTFASTAPNPLFIDFDNKLPWEVDCINMHSPEILKELCPKSKTPHRKEALLVLLDKRELFKDRTVIIDSMTMVGHEFDNWSELNPSYTKSGEVDKFAAWREKIAYFNSIINKLKALQTNCICTFHFQAERDKDGNLTGKYKPLISGQTADMLPSQFTHWVSLFVTKDKNTGVISRRMSVLPTPHIFTFLPPGWRPTVKDIEPTWQALMSLKPKAS